MSNSINNDSSQNPIEIILGDNRIENNKSNKLSELKLSEITDITFLQNEVKKLYELMDDIDTYTDMAKSDDKLFRSLTDKRIRKYTHENGLIGSDGYELYQIKSI